MQQGGSPGSHRGGFNQFRGHYGPRRGGRGRGRSRGRPDGGTSRRYLRHAAAAAGLEDESLEGDPIRVKYAEYFIDLIDGELEAEQAVIHERLACWSAQRLQREGNALFGMAASRHGYFFGQTVLRFSAPGGDELPVHKFSEGDMVTMSRQNPLTETPATGVVLDRSRRYLSVVFQDVPEDFSAGFWRVDQGANKVSHDRMAAALKSLARDIHEEDAPATSWQQAVVKSSVCDGRPTALGDIFFSHFETFEAAEQAASAPVMEDVWDEEEEEDSQSTVLSGALNEPQLAAIRAALKRRCTLLHGPPGTGKTWTSVNFIKLWCERVKRPILAVADSNVAVDNLLEGLLDLGVRAVRVGQPVKVRQALREATVDARMEAHPQYAELQRRKEALDDLNRGLRYMTGRDRGLGHRDLSRGWTQYRQLEQAMSVGIVAEAQVVCSTLIGAGGDMIQSMEFPYVLVDEATQATEPAVMVPLACGSVQIVLAGDHCQLPPVVLAQGRESRENLSVSLFERLVKMGVKPFLLSLQYRMHPIISMFPSAEFYDGRVQNAEEVEHRVAPPGFPWPSGLPLAFVPVLGGVEETTDGKSKRNVSEAAVVVRVVEQLVAAHRRREAHSVAPDGIGVVTPYLAQVSLLTDFLQRSQTLRPDAPRLEIKSVDGFQGREKEVIIFSAVRSNDSGEVGFLSDWRRMNVAITRPRRGLVVVGDARTMSADPHMKNWVQWVMDRELYVVDV